MSHAPPAKKSKFTDYKSKSHFRGHKKQYLEAGQRGFLATCNFREKDCVRECYNILNQYADELYGRQQVTNTNDEASAEADDADDVDILDDLQKEIAAANAAAGKQKGKDAPKPRFQVVDTGTTNCVFIKTTLSDPVELGQRVIGDIAASKEQKSRFLLRLVPIETVCKANLDDIVKAGGLLFDKYFLKQGSTFSIVFNKRYNNDVKRDDVIHALAALVQAKNVHNKVDLKHAAKSVVVEIIKGLCCISVVEDYLKHKKYNLVELANAKDVLAEEPKNEEKLSKQDDVAEKDEVQPAEPASKTNGDTAAVEAEEVEVATEVTENVKID